MGDRLFIGCASSMSLSGYCDLNARMYSITSLLVILADPCSSAPAILRAIGALEEERLTIDKGAGVIYRTRYPGARTLQ